MKNSVEKLLRNAKNTLDDDGLLLWAADKIEGLEADLENAVETAFNRGAREWCQKNYPDKYVRFVENEKSQYESAMSGQKIIDGLNEANKIVQRRFGLNHDLPCSRPNVLTCTMWECQHAGYCQADQKKQLGTGTIIQIQPS